MHKLLILFTVSLVLAIYLMNWNEIISKRTPVKAKDGRPCGYVIAEFNDYLLILDGKLISREYMVPKDEVDRYDGRELFVKIQYEMISAYPF
jgi:hypothetical protein